MLALAAPWCRQHARLNVEGAWEIDWQATQMAVAKEAAAVHFVAPVVGCRNYSWAVRRVARTKRGEASMLREVLARGGEMADGTLHPTARGTAEALVPTVWRENHCASLLQTRSGDVLLTWFAGTSEGMNDIKVVLSRLRKGSAQWEAPRRVSDDYECSEQNPMLYEDSDGLLWLYYTAQETRGVPRDIWEAVHTNVKFTMQETAIIRRRCSGDGGATWSGAVTFCERPGAFQRSRIIKLRDGSLVYPLYYSSGGGSDAYGDDRSVVMLSTDDGVSWNEVEVPESRGRVQGSPVELVDGSVAMFFRSRAADRIYVARSRDSGRTWSAPEPTVLPNNNASIMAVKLRSERIALVFNKYGPGRDAGGTLWPRRRYPVTIALSEDGGLSWPFQRHIDVGDGYAGDRNEGANRRLEYPAVIQDDDDLIHIAYSYSDRRCIKHVVVTEDWVIGNVPSGS